MNLDNVFHYPLTWFDHQKNKNLKEVQTFNKTAKIMEILHFFVRDRETIRLELEEKIFHLNSPLQEPEWS